MPYSRAPGPFCDTLSKDDYIYPDIARQSDFPADLANNCPLPAVILFFISNFYTKIYLINFQGSYVFHGTAPNLDNLPSMIASSGEYAGEVAYYKDDQNIATYRVYLYINNI